MRQYNINPLVEYGFVTENSLTDYRKQLKNQGMETDFHVEFGTGFKPGPPEPNPSIKGNFLTFTANENETTVVFLQSYHETPATYDMQYKKGDNSWVDYHIGSPDDNDVEIITLNEGESVMFKGVNPNGFCNQQTENEVRFAAMGSISASGDITSIVNGIGGDCVLPEGCFAYFFEGCTGLTTAPNLPSTTLADSCYRGMFSECASLTTAPELPATALTERCYDSMFYDCEELTTAPELPATTLVNSCYQSMFSGCIKIDYIEVPFTNVVGYSLAGWLNNTSPTGTIVLSGDLIDNAQKPSGWDVIYSSLSTPPIITQINDDRVSIKPYHYNAHISYTIQLEGGSESSPITSSGSVIITVEPGTIIRAHEYDDGGHISSEATLTTVSNINENLYFYVEDVSGQENGLFIRKNLNGASTITVYVSSDQVNWTLLGNTSTSAIAAAIPPYGRLYFKATAYRWGNYENYYERNNNISCTRSFSVGGNIMSLLYGDDFKGQTISSDAAFCGLFHSSSANTLVDASYLVLPSSTASGCYAHMFNGCTSLTSAPVLPATTLTSNCYHYMFKGCTELTTAPTLSATTLTSSCYGYMFYGCSKLSNITCLATENVTSYNTRGWVTNVAANGTFTKAASMTDWATGEDGIPSGWTVVDA